MGHLDPLANDKRCDMCIKAGADELETVKNLMGMSLRVVVADALHADIEAVTEEVDLVNDLHMDAKEEVELEAMIADIFDGLEVDVQQTPTFSALLDKVVLSEFRDVAAV